jgi:hypothetical protein
MALTTRGHYCNFQIFTHPWRLVTGKRAAHTAGPLGSTWPSPSNTGGGLNYQNVSTLQARWHVPWSKAPWERKEQSRQGDGSSENGCSPSLPNEWIMWPSDTPKLSFQRQGQEWNLSSVTEGRTNWELLIFQVCQVSVTKPPTPLCWDHF